MLSAGSSAPAARARSTRVSTPAGTSTLIALMTAEVACASAKGRLMKTFVAMAVLLFVDG
ncbi:hypothetical protein [Arthrobacter sp. TMS1-12-1]